MKQEVNEYYQCGKNGYVRYENVDVGQLKATKQVPVVSRCNQILPYKMHKLQVKEPITISSAKNIQSLPPIQQSKKETTMNYSFSTSLMENPNRILERDQVHSIHIDDKTSSRTKAQQRQLDLAKSTFTSLKKTKGDMKRSLFSINQSHFTNDTNSKDTQKIQMIISELIKEKQKREDFQRKYEVLLSLINREQDKKVTQSTNSQKEIPRRDSSPQTKKNRSKRKYQRSNTSSESQSQDQDQVIIDYGRKKNKTYRSPIIINLSPQMLNPQNQQNQSYEFKKIQQSESMIEIKENLSQIHQRVEMLHENMDFLEKKIDQQEAKRQKQMLLQELKQKERKIEEVMKQNLKMKEINDLLTGQKIIMKAEQQNHRSFFGIKIDKNPLAISFCLALVIILLLLNIRGAIC